MTTYITIIGDSDIRLWGLGGRERLQRMLRVFTGIELVEETAGLPAHAPVVVLRGDCLFDARILKALIGAETEFLLYAGGERPVAARVDASAAKDAAAVLRGEGIAPAGLVARDSGDLELGYEQNLKKYEPAHVFPVTPDNRRRLERELFAGSYKGVTDFITKWLWPVPARRVTRLCVRCGIRANHVTAAGLVLMLLASAAFWYGCYGTGLLLAWIMTFLDTVDGKLARVTVSSSRIGHALDHGMDVLHPPLWYLAWGMGLAGTSTPLVNLSLWLWLMLAGYVGGRLCEGYFEYRLASFALFLWRPLDSFNRLVTARRNPNLVLLTGGWLAGRPDLALMAVVAWHGISTLFLCQRMLAAARARRRGPLHSWLQTIDPVRDRRHLAVRLFTRLPRRANAGIPNRG